MGRMLRTYSPSLGVDDIWLGEKMPFGAKIMFWLGGGGKCWCLGGN